MKIDEKKEKFDKSKKRRYKSKSHDVNDEKRPYIGPNDINWRVRKDVLTLSAANLPFGVPIGVNMFSNSSINGSIFCVPGVFGVYTQLTLGAASDFNSPCNLAGRQTYQTIRRFNAGAKNYDSSNVTMIIGSVGQAYGFLGFLQRIYFTMNKFTSASRYSPRVLIEIQGVNYDDIHKHQAELAFLIAWMGNALKSLPVPDLSYFKACYEAYSYYFRDDESPKCQIYLNIPHGFAEYDPTNSKLDWDGTHSTILNFLGHGVHTYQDIYDAVHAIMDVLLSDADVATICGDILKAFGDRVYVPGALDMSSVEPKYSLEFLQQIHNLQCCPRYLSNYTEVAGTASTGPYLQAGWPTALPSASTLNRQAVKIDAYTGIPSPEEVVNCMVMQFNLQSGTDIDTVLPTAVFDLFIPTSIKMCLVAGDTPVYITPSIVSNTLPMQAYNGSMGQSASDRAFLTALTNFDWHPQLWHFLAGKPGHNWQIFGDVRNLNVFPTEIAKNIHVNSMLNLFDFTAEATSKLDK